MSIGTVAVIVRSPLLFETTSSGAASEEAAPLVARFCRPPLRRPLGRSVSPAGGTSSGWVTACASPACWTFRAAPSTSLVSSETGRTSRSFPVLLRTAARICASLKPWATPRSSSVLRSGGASASATPSPCRALPNWSPKPRSARFRPSVTAALYAVSCPSALSSATVWKPTSVRGGAPGTVTRTVAAYEQERCTCAVSGSTRSVAHCETSPTTS